MQKLTKLLIRALAWLFIIVAVFGGFGALISIISSGFNEFSTLLAPVIFGAIAYGFWQWSKSDEVATGQPAATGAAKEIEAENESLRKANAALAARLEAAKQKKGDVLEIEKQAQQQALNIISAAEKRAEEIAGDALRAIREADGIKATVQAMRNMIEGYGDRYMRPSHSALDDLALAYSHAQAGQELKRARERSRSMMEQGQAAECDYVERNRRDTAIRFVLDAFNGKTDSILSRVKVDNFGTLTQEIKDAAAMVNHHGSAFKGARVRKEYVDARIEELMWAVRANELREQDREEQRAIKERIREEERARKEYERALKDAEREEDLARKALEKAKDQLAKASDEQRQKYEDQIKLLSQKLSDAEEKGKRAISMAQQTRVGHVYVISNIGAFGENVYKIGMTRRLEPIDRIKELGDASVPFGFDIHAMIWSEDAPALEKALHREFMMAQVNKVNPRKEFFRLGLASVRQAVEKMGLNAAWTMAAEATEYRETLAMEAKMREDVGAKAEWERLQLLAEAQIEADEDAESQPAGHDAKLPGSGLFASTP